MNGLGEIQENIKSFICEKENLQKQIKEIEARRTQLAQERNEKKKQDANCEEVKQLGREVSELGNQSQELQNQLDFKNRTLKTQMNCAIDNLIAEAMRKLRIINEEIRELARSIELQNERCSKYELQKQEFYLRFGRMPELSERAKRVSSLQEKQTAKSENEIESLKGNIVNIEDELIGLAKVKNNLANGNTTTDSIKEENAPMCIEEITIEEMEPIEELYIEEFQPIEELHIEELEMEEFKEIDNGIETIENVSNDSLDEIEKLARAIVEEITAEQTKNYDIIDEQPLESAKDIGFIEDIITFEQEKEQKERVIIPLFGQKATISNIIVKFENGNLVYKAQMTDNEEVIIYPANFGTESVLLRDKQNREECKQILTDYAINEHKVLDKKIINKIDPLICELLIECAEKYGHNAQELMYNYATSFVDDNSENVPGIIYNISYIEQSNLSKKERAIMKKICRNARENDVIDIIESFSGFRRVKYFFKKLFAINNVKVLPEAKY